jgi:hypothetical protein
MEVLWNLPMPAMLALSKPLETILPSGVVSLPKFNDVKGHLYYLMGSLSHNSGTFVHTEHTSIVPIRLLIQDQIRVHFHPRLNVRHYYQVIIMIISIR